MFLKDPYTGKPSLAFTLYALDCEGELEPKENEEEEDDVQPDDTTG